MKIIHVTADKDVNIKAIFAVMSTTWVIVKIRPEKKFENFFSGLIFTASQIVFITAIAFALTSISAIHKYDF